nr:endonuclease/exonuclease/phosphatase family protein [Candidatus Sigynarchaeota archaeon]
MEYDYWKRTDAQRGAAWDFVVNAAHPDIALLQEVHPDHLMHSMYDLHYHKGYHEKNWGSAILSKKYPYFQVNFDGFYEGKNGLLCYEFQVTDKKRLTVINMYGKIDAEGYATTTMHHMLSDLTPILGKKRKSRSIVLGGDLNVSTQWDQRYPNKYPSHKIVFDRLDDFKLINCTLAFFGKYVQTYSHDPVSFPWQNDYIFISKDLKPTFIDCKVYDDQKMLELSDHFPLEITLNI